MLWKVSRRLLCSSTSDKFRVSEVVRTLTDTFAKAGVPEPQSSASHLVAGLLQCNNLKDLSDKCSDHVLTGSQIQTLNAWTECRKARMPVQYILKEWDFRDMTLKMQPPVFIPRPETEQLVELILPYLENKKLQSVLEIGCGTGAISLALLRYEPKLEIVAVDQSGLACLLAQQNAQKLCLDLDVVRSRLESDGNFKPELSFGELDVIVSNPPYVLRKDMTKLEPEISLYEDLRALDGGKDGLEVIRPILKLAERALKANTGRLFLEIDPCHRYLLPKALENQNGRTNLEIQSFHQDFNGVDRFVIMKRL